jgi:hypothetical protein
MSQFFNAKAQKFSTPRRQDAKAQRKELVLKSPRLGGLALNSDFFNAKATENKAEG